MTPNDLATSSPRSPSLFAYVASLVLLDARVLFSTQKVVDALDPSVHANRAAAERHHLFPKGYLKTSGVTEIRDTNQIANYALVDWGDNAAIGAPADYLPELLGRPSSTDLPQMYYWHALPDGWEQREYAEFLVARRELMAQVIKDGYEWLSGGAGATVGPDAERTIAELVDNGETTTVEFKSALRKNLHTNQYDPRIEHSPLKTIAGFLNAKGGRLIIGVADDGSAVGIQEDGFANEDKAYLHLVNLINTRIGPKHMLYVHVRFDDYKNRRVMVVDCGAARSPQCRHADVTLTAAPRSAFGRIDTFGPAANMDEITTSVGGNLKMPVRNAGCSSTFINLDAHEMRLVDVKRTIGNERSACG